MSFESIRKKYGFDTEPENTYQPASNSGSSFNEIRKKYGFTTEAEIATRSPQADIIPAKQRVQPSKLAQNAKSANTQPATTNTQTATKNNTERINQTIKANEDRIAELTKLAMSQPRPTDENGAWTGDELGKYRSEITSLQFINDRLKKNLEKNKRTNYYSSANELVSDLAANNPEADSLLREWVNIHQEAQRMGMQGNSFTSYQFLNRSIDRQKKIQELTGWDDKEFSENSKKYEALVNEQNMANAITRAQTLANEKPVAAWAASVATNIPAGLGYFDMLMQRAENKANGLDIPIDTNSPLNYYGNTTQAIRNQQLENIRNKYYEGTEPVDMATFDPEQARKTIDKNNAEIVRLTNLAMRQGRTYDENGAWTGDELGEYRDEIEALRAENRQLERGLNQDKRTFNEGLYGMITSTADSLVYMGLGSAVGGVTAPFISPSLARAASALTIDAVMGSQVAQSEFVNLIDQGYSDEYALASGAMKGAVEGFTEAVSVETILNAIKGGRTAWNVFIKPFLSEGGEELAANWLDRAVDSLLNGESETRKLFDSAYNEAIKEGETGTKAFLTALWNSVVRDDAEAMFWGGLSGMFMSGVGTGVNYAANRFMGAGTSSEKNQLADVQNAQTSDERGADLLLENVNRANAENPIDNVPAQSAAPTVSGTSEAQTISRVNETPTSETQTLGESTGRLIAEHESVNPAPARIVSNGESVTVNDFADAKSGTVYLSNGNTAKISEVAFDNSDLRAVYQSAAKYDTETANDIVNGYNGSSAYSLAADYFYEAGKSGNSFDYATKSAYNQYISQTVAQQIFADGRKALKASVASAVRNQSGRTAADVGTYFTRDYIVDGKLTKSQTSQLDFLEAFSNENKVRISAVKSLGGSVNAMYDPSTDTITVALDAKGGAYVAWASHEIAHRVKAQDIQSYEALRDLSLVFLEKQGSFNLDSRIRHIQRLYSARTGQNLSRADAIEEIVANTAIPALSNEDAIREFAEKNPSAAEKLLTKIKEIIADIKKAFSKINIEEVDAIKDQTDTLEKMRSVIEKSLRETGGVRTSEESIDKFSLADTADEEYKKPITIEDIRLLREIIKAYPTGKHVSVNDFTSEDIQRAQKWAYKYWSDFKKNGVNPCISPFFRAWFGDYRANEKALVSIAIIPEYIGTNEARKQNRGTFENSDTGWNIRVSRDGENNTISHAGDQRLSELGLAGIQSLVKNAVLLDSEVHEHHSNNSKDESTDTIAFDHKMYSLGTDDSGNVALYKITVEESFQSKKNPTDRRFHNLKYIEKVAELSADALAELNRSGGSTNNNSTTNYTISDLYSLVKQYDKDFHVGKEVNSALLNEDGTPKIMYHGSSEDFTIFDKNKQKRKGFYFTDNYEYAKGYERQKGIKGLRNTPNGTTYSSYLHMNKPFDIRTDSDALEIYKRIEKSINEKGYYAETLESGLPHAVSGDEIYDYIKENNLDYDGIILDEGDGTLSYVVFEPTQIKSATDNIGTFDKSNSDIRYSINEDFSDQVDAVLANTFDKKNHVYMGNTPVRLSQILGLPTLPMLITNNHVYSMSVSEAQAKAEGRYQKGTHYHDLGDIVKEIPRLLNSPAVIIKSSTKEADISIAVVTSAVDKQGRPVMVAIKPYGKGNYYDVEIDSNAVLTGYGKNNIINYVKTAKNEGRILYINKKSNQHGNTTGVQFPNNIINTDYSNSLARYKELVNRQTVSNNIFNNVANYSAEAKKSLNEIDELEQLRQEVQDSEVERDQFSATIKAQDEIIKGLKAEFEITKGHKLNKAKIDMLANKIIRNARSKMDQATLSDELQRLFDYIADGQNLDFNTIMDVSTAIAKNVLSKSENIDASLYNQYADLRKTLRTEKFTIPEDIRAEVAEYDGGWNNFRRKNFGRWNLTNDGASLDSKWGELASKYPEFFDINATPQEQVAQIEEMFDAITPSIQNPYALDMDTYAYDLATQIYDDYFDIPEVKTFADKKQRELNLMRARLSNRWQEEKQRIKDSYEQKLSDLKNTQKSKIAELTQKYNSSMGEQKQYYRDMISKLRNEKNEKILSQRAQMLNQKYKELNRLRESRAKQIYNDRIRSIMRDFSERLRSNTPQKHVPLSLVRSIVQLCEAVDSKYNNESIQNRLQSIREAYADMMTGGEDTTNNPFNDAVTADIAWLKDFLAERNISELSAAELKEIYDVLHEVRHVINNVNRTFTANRKATIDAYAEETASQLRSQRKKRQIDGKAYDLIEKLGWGSLKPIYAFRAIGSNTLTELYENIRSGEDTWARDIYEARQKFEEASKATGRRNFDMEKSEEFETERGESIRLTLAQKMSIYALSKRSQAVKHLIEGGIVLDETASERKGLVKYKTEKGSATQLTMNDVTNIVGSLTNDQRKYVDIMQKYLSTELSEKGNEVTRKLYDIEKFKEKNYFPIKSSNNYLRSNNSPQADRKIKNASFTKDVVKGANNPVTIEDFDAVWARHVDEMSLFHAFTLPLEDFNRVFSYKTSVSPLIPSYSIKSLLEDAHGKAPGRYVSQLITDINGGVRKQAGAEIGNALMSAMKKGAVFGSLSVAIQQPSAIGRAMAIIDPKYFIKTSFRWADFKEAMEYAPIARIKSMGYFDTNISQSTAEWLLKTDYTGTEKIKAFFTDKGFRKDAFDEALTLLPEAMDAITWSHIWNACKAEQEATNKYAHDSEALKQAAAKRFTEVIERTQVYDSVFSRSELMRSKDSLVKMATAFMAEPTTTLNMLIDGAQTKKNGGKYLARVMTSFIFATTLNAVLKSFVTAGRNDDEDKSYAEKYIGNVVGNFIDDANPLGMIPYVRDVMSIFKGYDVERADMTVFTNLYNSFNKLTKAMENGEGMKEAIESAAGSISAMFGVPIGNVIRDIKTVLNIKNDFFVNKNETTSIGILHEVLEAIGYKITADKLSEAMISGSEEDANLMRELLHESGMDDEKIEKKFAEILLENEDIISYAARYADGDVDALEEVIDVFGGYGFETDTVTKAVRTYADRTIDGKEKTNTNTAAGTIYRWDDLYKAMDSGDKGDTRKVAKAILDGYQESGKTVKEAKSTLRTQLTKQYKPEYIEANSARRREIREALYNSLAYDSYDDIDKRLREWLDE